MACPFFEPTAILETGPWAHPPRLPLGGTFSGLCHAEGARPVNLPGLELCNHGYARGQCGHFPSACQADAVRFSLTQEQPLRLVYILEKDHAPLEYGELDQRVLASNGILAAQARAFLSASWEHASDEHGSPKTARANGEGAPVRR